MCEYCYIENTTEILSGDDGVYYDEKDSKHYLYVEHFRNEKYWIEVNFCPRCGRKLQV